MNSELAKLEEDIAKVRLMIADRKAKYADVPQPKTQVGWSSYIVNNDRGMLDKNQDAERQWYTLKEQERHADELANKQRIQQDLINMDENMHKRDIAASEYQYAVAARKADTSGDKAVKAMLKQKEAEAKATLDYWNKRAGFNPDVTTQKELEAEANTPEGNTPTATDNDANKKSNNNDSTTKVQIEDLKSIKSVKNQAELDDILRKMEAHPAMKNNPEFKKEYNRIKSIVPNDVQAANKAARYKKYEEGKKLSGYDLRDWANQPENKKLIKEFGPIGKYTGD